MDQIDKAVLVLDNGGVIIYPTDTAYGIGSKADNNDAVKRVYKIKNRPHTQPVSVLVDSKDMALTYFDNPPDIVVRLMDEYWPGGLTIVYYKNKDTVSSIISGGTDTVGLRAPNHPVTLKIIKGIGVGLIGPSANFRGEKTPFVFSDLNKELIGKVDYVVNEKSYGDKTSTVINCTTKPFTILRQGSCIIDQKYLQ